MSFSADWLALRAEADRRARNPGLAERLSAHFAGREGLCVLDLGAGTGAMPAATAPLLGPGQNWRLIDSDATLLARVELPDGIPVERTVADLAVDMAPLFRPAPDLITCSAFLDLCGAGWLDRLVTHAAAAGAAVYAVLGYDGREDWSPPHPLDADVLAAFHADQHRDKGLGPALGPEAAIYLATALRAGGFEVLTAQSDWHLATPTDAALIAGLARGNAEAVTPALGPRAAEWGESRAAATAVRIGHVDLLALPPPRP
ncbi:MAG TPA: class I SAM-dependent methyltransferase [Paracoccaceae bacterium]|nr:class I SAM-dependent methyltransferase [Paracoccaceae bacterium]